QADQTGPFPAGGPAAAAGRDGVEDRQGPGPDDRYAVRDPAGAARHRDRAGGDRRAAVRAGPARAHGVRAGSGKHHRAPAGLDVAGRSQRATADPQRGGAERPGHHQPAVGPEEQAAGTAESAAEAEGEAPGTAGRPAGAAGPAVGEVSATGEPGAERLEEGEAGPRP